MMDAAQVERLMFEYQHPYMGWNTETRACDIPSVQAWDSWGLWDELDYNGKSVDVPGLGVVSAAEFDTGGEGHGENVSMVFKIHRLTEDEEWTKYYRVDGYYASFDGTTWDGDLYEVQPVERMVTFYEKAE